MISFHFCLCLLAQAMLVTAQVPTESRRHEFTQVHMGMPVRVVLYAAEESKARSAARAIFGRIAELDRDLSDYRADSELRRIENGAGTWVRVKPTTLEVLQRALEVARASGGAFDPTIGPLTVLWRNARQTKQLPSSEKIAAARALVSYQYLELDASKSEVRLARPGMKLDLGAIAKGFILDQALLTVRDRAPVLIEAGGDIVVGRPPPDRDWRIEVPGADSAFVARAGTLQHGALSTSGPSQQFVEIDGTRYSHVVDARTGVGLTHAITAHVIARNGVTADAIATTLTLLHPRDRPAFIARFPGIIFSVTSVTAAREGGWKELE